MADARLLPVIGNECGRSFAARSVGASGRSGQQSSLNDLNNLGGDWERAENAGKRRYASRLMIAEVRASGKGKAKTGPALAQKAPASPPGSSMDDPAG